MAGDSDIIVVGGGAAGLVAAIAAAREGAQVTILEAATRVGQKILKTGNGRCNLTNARILPSDYNDPEAVAPIIESFAPRRVLEFFDGLGLVTIEDAEGRVYPLSNAANSVLDVLRDEYARLGVRLLCEHEAIGIESAKDKIEVRCANGSLHVADRVIVATGGATRLLASLDHEISSFLPVLCPLKTDTQSIKGLSGVRARATVRACRQGMLDRPYAQMNGELLFRDYGLSGIVIFDMSRLVDIGDMLMLDFVPVMEEDELFHWLTSINKDMQKRANKHKNELPTYIQLLSGLLHPRIARAVLRKARIKPSQGVQERLLGELAHAIKAFSVQVTGRGSAAQAQVTRGGALLSQFDPITLESRLHPGVYAAGETLDVDGRCGGFNLHWAWASGLAAGMAAACDAG